MELIEDFLVKVEELSIAIIKLRDASGTGLTPATYNKLMELTDTLADFQETVISETGL